MAATLPSDLDAFYMLCGKCISHWANIESRLFDVFKLCLGAPSEKASASLFYGQSRTLGHRLSITNDILKTCRAIHPAANDPPHTLQTEWDAIHGKTDDLIPFRNYLAHRAIITVREEVPDILWVSDTVEYEEIAVLDEDHAKRLQGKTRTGRIKRSELEKHWTDIMAITQRLDKFLPQLRAELLKQ